MALVEAASLGLGTVGRQSAVALAAAMSGRQERSLKWAQGALAKAIEAREAAIRSVRGTTINESAGRGSSSAVLLCLLLHYSAQAAWSARGQSGQHMECQCTFKRVLLLPCWIQVLFF